MRAFAALMAAATMSTLATAGPAYPDTDPRNRGQALPSGGLPKRREPKEPDVGRQAAAREKRARRAAKRRGE